MPNRTQNTIIGLMTVVVFSATGYVLLHNPKPIVATPSSSPAIGPTTAAATQQIAPSTVAVSTPPTTGAQETVAPGHLAVDHLRQVAKSRTPIVTFLGSSLTAGCCASDFGHTWPWLVQQKLQDAVGKLTVTRHVFPGTTLVNIVAKGGIVATVADKPDLVLFETSGTNDCGQDVPPAKSQAALRAALSALRKGLPHAVILVQTSSPKTDPHICAGNLPYPQFMAAQAAVLRHEHGILFLDLYAKMEAQIGSNLKPYLHDQTHPNDSGAAVWADILEKYLGV